MSALAGGGWGLLPLSLLFFHMGFHLRSFFFRPEDGTRIILMDGTYCKLMIMIYCVVILYVHVFFGFFFSFAVWRGFVKVAA